VESTQILQKSPLNEITHIGSRELSEFLIFQTVAKFSVVKIYCRHRNGKSKFAWPKMCLSPPLPYTNCQLWRNIIFSCSWHTQNWIFGNPNVGLFCSYYCHWQELIEWSNGNIIQVLNLAPHHGDGSGGIAPYILNLFIRWKWWSTSFTSGFTPRERAPGTFWIRGWVGSRAIPPPNFYGVLNSINNWSRIALIVA
jgi:hypothetical protein